MVKLGKDRNRKEITVKGAIESIALDILNNRNNSFCLVTCPFKFEDNIFVITSDIVMLIII